MKPKADEIAQWIGGINDAVSMNFWIREVFKELIGRDPVYDVIQMFSGDWEVFGRYGHAWLTAGGAVDDMRSNIEYLDDALAQTWSGNAADAAFSYLQHLSAAMGNEKAYSDYLFDVCKAYLEMSYWGYELLNYFVGEAIDLALESVGIFSGIFTGGWGTVIDAFIALADAIMFIVDFFRQVYHGWNIVAAAMGIPTEEPPFTLPALLLDDPSGRSCIAPPLPR